MATDDTMPALPGDIIQDAQGHLYLVSETHGWGVGAVQRWRDPGGEDREAYHRFSQRSGYVIVGACRLTPPEVAERRRDALATRKALADERGEPFLPTPIHVIHDLLRAHERDAEEAAEAYERASAWLREQGL